LNSGGYSTLDEKAHAITTPFEPNHRVISYSVRGMDAGALPRRSTIDGGLRKGRIHMPRMAAEAPTELPPDQGVDIGLRLPDYEITGPKA